MGAELLVETLPGYLSGSLQPQPQDERLSTYAGQLRKEDGQLDWSRPAVHLARQVRAYSPWPGTYTLWQGQPLKVLWAHADPSASAPPGLIVEAQGGLGVGTADGVLVLDEVQPAGRKPMRAEEFARGARGLSGSLLPMPGK